MKVNDLIKSPTLLGEVYDICGVSKARAETINFLVEFKVNELKQKLSQVQIYSDYAIRLLCEAYGGYIHTLKYFYGDIELISTNEILYVGLIASQHCVDFRGNMPDEIESLICKRLTDLASDEIENIANDSPEALVNKLEQLFTLKNMSDEKL